MSTVQAPGRTGEHGTRLSDAAAGAFRDWRSGDDDALDRLVRMLTPLLWHLARAYRIDDAAAEDAVQATWLSLVRSADSVRDPQAVLRWLSVTVRRHAARTATSSGKVVPTQPEDLSGEGGAAEREATEPGPEAVVVSSSAASVLWAHVAALPERCQRLLRVVAFSDTPDYAELSASLAMPVGSIGPTRRRCLGKLRAALDSDARWDWS